MKFIKTYEYHLSENENKTMIVKEFNEQFCLACNYEPIRTNKDVVSRCRGCAYEVRCEKDTSWRGRCPDYAECAYDEYYK